jgi:hypothetical protein
VAWHSVPPVPMTLAAARLGSSPLVFVRKEK